jgi:hypothetical protein
VSETCSEYVILIKKLSKILLLLTTPPKIALYLFQRRTRLECRQEPRLIRFMVFKFVYSVSKPVQGYYLR